MNTVQNAVHSIRSVDLFMFAGSVIITVSGLLTHQINWLLA